VINRLEVCAAKRQNVVVPEEWEATKDRKSTVRYRRRNSTKKAVQHYFGGQSFGIVIVCVFIRGIGFSSFKHLKNVEQETRNSPSTEIVWEKCGRWQLVKYFGTCDTQETFIKMNTASLLHPSHFDLVTPLSRLVLPN
jgi:hypothetical protein